MAAAENTSGSLSVQPCRRGVCLRGRDRGYTEGGLFLDQNFERNLRGALDAGLDVGVYFFSQSGCGAGSGGSLGSLRFSHSDGYSFIGAFLLASTFFLIVRDRLREGRQAGENGNRRLHLSGRHRLAGRGGGGRL